MTGAVPGVVGAALSPALEGRVRAWLTEMQQCVRERDFERARELFSPEVVAFGTVTAVADGLEPLERAQWRRIWDRTTGFTFELHEARSMVVDGCACIAVPWRSRGARADGSGLERRGRATLVLAESRGRLVAVHSHFSMWPREGR